MADGYEELRRLAAEATPGPWRTLNVGWVQGNDGRTICALYATDKPTQGQTNGALIVAAINAVPSLLAELDALREDARKLRAMLVDVTHEATDWNGTGEHLISEALIERIDAAMHPGKDAGSGEGCNGN